MKMQFPAIPPVKKPDPKRFQIKEARLQSALQKVQDKIQIEESDHKDCQLLYFLENRLNDRLFTNYSAFQDWHFQTYGWAAYEIK
jgi:hypothetical protein